MTDPILLLAILLVGLGIGGVAIGFTTRARERDRQLALAIGFAPPSGGTFSRPSDRGTVVNETLGLAERAIRRWDSEASLRRSIERADLAVQPAEMVVLGAAGGTAVAATLFGLTRSGWAALVPLLAAPFVVQLVVRVLAARRVRRFAEQLPDALSLISASMDAGHTFLRALQILAAGDQQPIAGEIRRVVNETELGSPLVESLERLSARIGLRDLELVVEAIRIQQTAGGQLAELLDTLSGFMRSREEIRREIAVLTAEGRASAWVLGALPIALVIAIVIFNPGYLDPMLVGWGPFWLGMTALSVFVGILIILRMVRSVNV